jgi:biotin carboxyl carrier protein
MEDLTIKVDGKEYHVKVEETDDNKILVHCNGDIYEVDSKPTEAGIFERLKKKEAKETGTGTVTSPLPGTVYEIKVKKGEKVKESQPLIKLIAMKMENEITAPKAGIIKEIKVKKGQSVNKGDILIIIS